MPFYPAADDDVHPGLGTGVAVAGAGLTSARRVWGRVRGPDAPLGGYTLVSANDLAAAVAAGCGSLECPCGPAPFVLEVVPAMSWPEMSPEHHPGSAGS